MFFIWLNKSIYISMSRRCGSRICVKGGKQDFADIAQWSRGSGKNLGLKIGGSVGGGGAPRSSPRSTPGCDGLCPSIWIMEDALQHDSFIALRGQQNINYSKIQKLKNLTKALPLLVLVHPSPTHPIHHHHHPPFHLSPISQVPFPMYLRWDVQKRSLDSGVCFTSATR